MTYIEYPKALYLRGWAALDACVVVTTSAEEQHARAQGYRHLAEPVAGDDADDAPKRRGRPPKAPHE